MPLTNKGLATDRDDDTEGVADFHQALTQVTLAMTAIAKTATPEQLPEQMQALRRNTGAAIAQMRTEQRRKQT